MPLGDDGETGALVRNETRPLLARERDLAAPVAYQAGAGGEFRFDLMAYWRFLWKHRLIFSLSVIVALALGVTVTLMTTPLYVARMTLEIERASAKVVNLQEVTPREEFGNGLEFYQTQYGLLRSRALAERVVDALDLTQSQAFLHANGLDAIKPDPKVDPARRRTNLREAVINRTAAGLSVNPVRGSRLVQLMYQSTSPALSAQLANAFADNFISMNLERKFESSAYAREFLEKQIAQTKAKLEESERQSVAYAVQQQIVNLGENRRGSGQGAGVESLTETNLSAINAAYAAATAARIAAEQKWRQSQGAGLGVSQVLQSATVQELGKEKAKLEAEYQDNLRIYKSDYPAMTRLRAQIDELDRQIQAEAARVRQSLYGDYAAALNQERALASKVGGLKSDVLNLRERSIHYNFLQRELDTNRTIYDALLQRYKEVGVTAGVATNNVSVVDRAQTPRAPSKPRPMINLALALLMGLAAGGVFAFVAEALDQAIRHPSEIEAKLRLPLLGSVPLLTRGVSPKEAMQDSRSPFWESYFSVRTALQFSTSQGLPHSLLVVSTRPAEGKTTTSIALAYSLARLGSRTLLVDGDLRKPSLHQVLGLDSEMGLSNILTGAKTLEEVVQEGAIANLSIVTSGPIPPTPPELLAGERLEAFCAAAEQAYDVVIFDGPPVLGFADAPLIASVTAGTIMVVEAGRTGRSQIVNTLNRLGMARAKVLGVVLTKFNARQAAYGAGYGEAYAYDYAYGRDTAASKHRAGAA